LSSAPAQPAHLLTLYRTDGFLCGRVAAWLAEALRGDGGAIALTEARYHAHLRQALALEGVDADALTAAGRLVILDAAATLARILASGPPTTEAVRRVAGPWLDSVRAASGPEIRAYGDMVNVLWERGQPDVALVLEQIWHELLQGTQVELLCGYRADPLSVGRVQGLQALCGAHHGLYATEDAEARERAIGQALAEADRAADGPAELALLSLVEGEARTGRRVAARAHSLLATQAAAFLDRVPDPTGLFASFLHHASVGFQIFDRDGRSTFANDRFKEMFGLKPPPEYSLFEDPLLERLGLASSIRAVYEGETAELGPFWYDPNELGLPLVGARRAAIQITLWPLFDSAGDVSHAAIVYRDATAETLTRDELLASERHFRALVETGRDVIWLEDAGGRITWASPSCERVLGYAADWFLGRRAADLVHPDDQGIAARAREQVAGATGAAASHRYRLRRADGCWRWMDAVATNRLDEPDVGGVVVSQHDVSEQLEAEDRARSAQKLEAVGRLAGGIAHDFNNLLSVISGNAHLAARRVDRGADPRGDLAVIQAATERGAALTRQLLAFGRRGVRNPESLDAGAVIEEMRPLLERAVGEHLTLEVRSGGPAWVRIDRSQLEQVVLNLVVNARDATPAGGTIRVEAEARGDEVAVRVTDTGRGVDPAILANLFEPFVTTKPGGHGLGLSTVHGVATEAGGSVRVRSELGRGAEFEVVLPQTAPAVQAVGRSGPVVPGVVGVETLLVAEDEPEVRRYLAEVLSEAGYRVHVVDSAEEGARVADALEGPLHGIVTDVVMRGATGRELVRHVRQRHPDVRAVYVSGYADSAELASELPRGARFVQKPVGPDHLLSVVREVLDGGRVQPSGG
jgi:two-component system cell cycle sensor histidine kinase/response regulator CckA